MQTGVLGQPRLDIETSSQTVKHTQRDTHTHKNTQILMHIDM